MKYPKLESKGKIFRQPISNQRAHIIMPYHVSLDKAKESLGDKK